MRTFLLLFLYVIIALLAIPLIFVCALFKWVRPLVFVGRTGVHLGKLILGVRVEVTGLDKIEKHKTYVFMPNHESFVDGPMMFVIIPQFMRVILKKEIFRVPILAQGMKVAEFIPVDRKGRSGGKEAIERAVRLIQTKKHSFLIFPEGTRSLDGKLQRFRRGGCYLAIKSQVPIVPVSINGSFELMPKGSFFTKKGTIRVQLHEPVPMEGYSEKTLDVLKDRVYNMVLSGLEDNT